MPDVRLRHGPWQIRFNQSGDRQAHEIALLRDGQSIPLLQSVEGAASDLWPPSPALQNLHVEQRDEGQVALLVGMAGRSHWSASVEAGGEEGLHFDIACRIQQSDAELGSTYALSSGMKLEGSTLHLDGAAIGSLVCHQGTKLETLPEDRLRLAPGESPQSATTIRWSYRLTSRLL